MARQTGGTVNAGSGAFLRKGDVRSGNWLIEAKWTANRSFTLKSDVLEKVVKEAYAEGRRPIVQIEMNGKCYGILEWDDILEVLFP